MTATGFYAQKQVRPGGMALVIALHAAVLGSLVMIKTTGTILPRDVIDVIDIPIPPEPKENPPPPPPRPEPPQHQSVLDAPQPVVPTQPQGPAVTERPLPPVPPTGNIGPQIVTADATPDVPRIPVRREAQFDPRYANELQPEYPASEQRAQRDGTVRVRLTIGADGRVKAVERLSATSDAFWRATERHALAHWRFRPATVDGRPVETTKVMTVTFQIEV